MSVFDGDGRPAIETSFYFPLDVEFNTAGRPLILDFNNLRVRRIDEDGLVWTYIGTDFEDYPINGAPVSQTALHHSSDLAYDSQGRLYVAGDHAPIVFRVNVDDRVELLAGNGDFGNDGDDGPALAARLTTPYGVAPDPRGGFYVSDLDAHVIRHVDAAGVISTVVGTGVRGYSGDNGPGRSAQISGPTRLALDADGRLYICDTGNHCIRRLELDGTVTTFVGTGTIGYSGDGGPATGAQLSAPYDAKFGPDGAMYIADTGNNVIRRVQDGVIRTFVGSGSAGFSGDSDDARTCALNGPSSVTFAADGSLWVSDTFNQRIRRIAQAMTLVAP
jgi:sugar lactone lactonase YvrE